MTTTQTTQHQAHAEKLMTRPHHPTPWLARCLNRDCPWVTRHATEDMARAAVERHEQRGEGAG